MNQDPQILVIGGTRGTGHLVVQSLLQQSQRVRVLARDPDQAATRPGSAVEVVPGDLTRPETLPAAVQDVSQIIFTAGVSAGPARESMIVATEYEGVVHTLDAAREVGFSGRFVYMTSLGTTRRSFTAGLLNLVKRNTLRWRKKAEEDIRASDVDYRPGGCRGNDHGGTPESARVQHHVRCRLGSGLAPGGVERSFRQARARSLKRDVTSRGNLRRKV